MKTALVCICLEVWFAAVDHRVVKIAIAHFYVDVEIGLV